VMISKCIFFCHAELAKHLITFARFGLLISDESSRDKLLPSSA
jgi:hypothetical protein